MPLQLPNLDDRSFEEMLEEAIDEIRRHLGSDWNDLSPSDPGIVLLEAFTYLTEQLIFRLNRLPQKAYIAFLRLLGVTQNSTKAAIIKVQAQYSATDATIQIEKGTRLTLAESGNADEGPIFYLDDDLLLPDGKNMTTARQFQFIAAEQHGPSQGKAGESYTVRHAPIVQKMQNGFDVIVAVEIDSKERRQLSERDYQVVENLNKVRLPSSGNEGQSIFKVTINNEDKFFRIWQEVANFANLSVDDSHVFTVDRLDGIVQFAPIARYTSQLRDTRQAHSSPVKLSGLEAIPPKNSEILIWYPHGGGPAGNLPPETRLKIVDEDVAKVDIVNVLESNDEISNEASITGLEIKVVKLVEPGLPAETLADALIRGPRDLFALRRAITTSEIEAVTMKRAEGLIHRARAYTMKDRWVHAQPGTIGIVLVPAPKSEQFVNGRQTPSPNNLLRQLQSSEDQDVLDSVQETISNKIPAGIPTEISWSRYKQIAIEAEVEVEMDASPGRTADELKNQLNQFLAPETWPFGRPLQIKEIYSYLNRRDVARDVLQVLNVTVRVANAPDKNVTQIVADYFQPHTWYATSETRLFRSLNDGWGWEMMMQLDLPDVTKSVNMAPDEETSTEVLQITDEAEAMFSLVCAHPNQPGVVAAVSIHRKAGSDEWFSRLYLTDDCWESSPLMVKDPGSMDTASGNGELRPKELHFKIEDMAWLQHGDDAFLLLATDKGLYDLKVTDENGRFNTQFSSMQHISILTARPDYPLYAVSVIEGSTGISRVAVALKSRKGVFISQGGLLKKDEREAIAARQVRDVRGEVENLLGYNIPQAMWEQIINENAASAPKENPAFDTDIWEEITDLVGEDIRQLTVQYHKKEHIFLWAAARAKADRGKGCFRIRFDIDAQNRQAGNWVDPKNWTGGSCLGVACLDDYVFAATAYRGVLRLKIEPDNPNTETWQLIERDQLPKLPFPHEHVDLENELKEEQFFVPLFAVAGNGRAVHPVDAKTEKRPLLLVGGPQGIYRTTDLGDTFEEVSQATFRAQRDVITLPRDWLFVSGEHQVVPRLREPVAGLNEPWGAIPNA